ncbi:hypothetical protein AYW79_08325 [Ferroacidibacillus organovorans]|uniref:Uncharacterized protein n=2 Tax=Ferroacidibacillus organovorans TaxID=1765683 RepID=A0A162S196_9BACL|nr:hypothetical protein AYJ22_14600 [Ferroacidibacillus organovorans]OAG93855.1 hypothetical protein AYW79_08325 [Ferroacidibacillus organovorans]OPG15872.1 hypothetical protein B2M26_09710 [Ferroacidibacillus organovorans]
MRGKTGGLNKLTWFVLFLLTLQYIFGIIANLYVTIPYAVISPARTWSGLWVTLNWSLAHSPPILAAHAGTGVLLVLITCAGAVRAFFMKGMVWRSAYTAGLLILLFAGYNGVMFLISHGANVYSMWMSFAYIAVLAVFFGALYTAKRI